MTSGRHKHQAQPGFVCFLCPGYSSEFPTNNDSSVAPNTTFLSKVLKVASLLLITCQVSENFLFSLSRIAEKKKGKPVNLSISFHHSLPPAQKNRHTHMCAHTRPCALRCISAALYFLCLQLIKHLFCFFSDITCDCVIISLCLASSEAFIFILTKINTLNI